MTSTYLRLIKQLDKDDKEHSPSARQSLYNDNND